MLPKSAGIMPDRSNDTALHTSPLPPRARVNPAVEAFRTVQHAALERENQRLKAELDAAQAQGARLARLLEQALAPKHEMVATRMSLEVAAEIDKRVEQRFLDIMRLKVEVARRRRPRGWFGWLTSAP